MYEGDKLHNANIQDVNHISKRSRCAVINHFRVSNFSKINHPRDSHWPIKRSICRLSLRYTQPSCFHLNATCTVINHFSILSATDLGEVSFSRFVVDYFQLKNIYPDAPFRWEKKLFIAISYRNNNEGTRCTYTLYTFPKRVKTFFERTTKLNLKI